MLRATNIPSKVGELTIHHVINDADLENGGAQGVARRLHAGLRERGWGSRLVSVIRSEAKDDAGHSSFGLTSPYDLRAIARLVRYMRSECQAGDVIHAHLFPTMLYASMAARVAGWRGKLVCTEHSTSNRRRGTIRGRAIDRILYSRYDRVACISRGTRDNLATWMPSVAPRTVVVENGAPLAFNQIPERGPTERPIIVSVGRLSKPKNYDTALRALALLQDHPFEYRIAGTGPEEDALRRLCTQLGLDDRVRFLGFVEDVPSLLRDADIFLMPSRWEGFGLSAVEAMNAGLPVIVSDVDGLREIVAASPPCGLFVDPLDPSSIAKAVQQLLDAPEARQSYGLAGYQCSQRYSIDAMVDNYMKFYRSL